MCSETRRKPERKNETSSSSSLAGELKPENTITRGAIQPDYIHIDHINSDSNDSVQFLTRRNRIESNRSTQKSNRDEEGRSYLSGDDGDERR